MRARAVSRFYIALPLSFVLMGSIAGWLLGLAGWQWLFLIEGLPAALYGFVILRMLPDGPEQATWLTADEKRWIKARLDADGAKAHLGPEASVLRTLLSPKVWSIGLFFFCALTCSYAYNFSAPAILQGVTGWSVGRVGALVACFGLAGAARMLFGGANSDRTGDRALHCVVPCCVMAAGFFVASYGRPPWLVVTALGVSFVAFNALQAPALAVPTQLLAGRAAATGIAAINTITMFSGFLGPYWMGRVKDATGSYGPGLLGLIVPSLLAAGVMFAVTRNLPRAQQTIVSESLADEPTGCELT
jgi:MFS transporter, ACS family, tartrate transporter